MGTETERTDLVHRPLNSPESLERKIKPSCLPTARSGEEKKIPQVPQVPFLQGPDSPKGPLSPEDP